MAYLRKVAKVDPKLRCLWFALDLEIVVPIEEKQLLDARVLNLRVLTHQVRQRRCAYDENREEASKKEAHKIRTEKEEK